MLSASTFLAQPAAASPNDLSGSPLHNGYNWSQAAIAAISSFADDNDPKENPTSSNDQSHIVAFQYVGIVVLNVLSALFSGLVLGLLSLDVTELEILRKCGTERERQYAATIIPMRRNSNLLLCSLVIGNVVVNSGLQWLLDSVFNGLIGFMITTVCITIFGEILPQAVCARHGLAIGAKTVWITWIVIVITFPVAYPLSILLDLVLGEEIAFVYDRDRLQEYIRITRSYNNFDAQEVNIITGALKIKKVTVSHVMTKLKDVFMLPIESIVNYQLIATIVKRGFSRIPIYERSRRDLVGLLMVKDLALVNPYTEVTLKSLIQFYKHPVILVDENHTLDLVFNHFREGKSHMAFVREHKKRDIIGIVTLEDIIEEVLQVEINDETDIVTDNREFKHRPDAQIPNDLDALHFHLTDAIARRRLRESTREKVAHHGLGHSGRSPVSPNIQQPAKNRSSSRSRKQRPDQQQQQQQQLQLPLLIKQQPQQQVQQQPQPQLTPQPPPPTQQQQPQPQQQLPQQQPQQQIIPQQQQTPQAQQTDNHNQLDLHIPQRSHSRRRSRSK